MAYQEDLCPKVLDVASVGVSVRVPCTMDFENRKERNKMKLVKTAALFITPCHQGEGRGLVGHQQGGGVVKASVRVPNAMDFEG